MSRKNPLNHPTSIEWPVAYVVVVPYSLTNFSHYAAAHEVRWTREEALRTAVDGWAFRVSREYRSAPPTDPKVRSEVWRKLYLKGYRVRKVRLVPVKP